jgi:hypothetical protein
MGFQQMALDQHIHLHKKEFRFRSYTFIKTNSKMDQGLKSKKLKNKTPKR